MTQKIFVHVDIESTGPNPYSYDLVSFGAAAFAELAPKNNGFKAITSSVELFDSGTLDKEGLLGTFYSRAMPPMNDDDGEAFDFYKWRFHDDTLDWWVSEAVSKEAFAELVSPDREQRKRSVERFVVWLDAIQEGVEDPELIFVSFPAGFDWMFIVQLFDSVGVENPFGYFPVCLASAVYGSNLENFAHPRWGRGNRRILKELTKTDNSLVLHNGLDDAEMTARQHKAWISHLSNQTQ